MQNVMKSLMRGARPAPLKTCHTPRNSVEMAETQAGQGVWRDSTKANRWRHLTRNCACNPYGDLEVLWRRSVEKGRFNIRLDEATTLFLNGETETAKLMLRDLINATLGFEQLAQTVEYGILQRYLAYLRTFLKLKLKHVLLSCLTFK